MTTIKIRMTGVRGRRPLASGAPVKGRYHRAVTLVALFGIAAAVVAVTDLVPYVRDILRGLTQPHRGTWLIWSTLGVVVLASQVADGATWSLALVGAQAVTTILVLVLSLRFGVGGASGADLSLIGLAALGIGGWAISSRPVVATICVVAADVIGLAMMVPKTWRNPWSETASTFALASASGVCGAIAALILRRRRSIRPETEPVEIPLAG
jgi:hypothetical protein